MKSNKGLFALLAASLLLVIWLVWSLSKKPIVPPPVAPPPLPAAPVAPKTKPKDLGRKTAVSPKPAPTPVPAPPPKPAPAAQPAPAVVLHKELIPKDITIIRCYYSKEIMAPGAVFGFDINGSGFTAEFQNMIVVDPGGADIRVKNLRLVTANQIHGDMEVGPGAKTQYVYPKILIQNLPVFQAPEPFGVVRPGEALDIKSLEVSADGHSMKFRIITNIDQAKFLQFYAEPTKPGITISLLEPTYPFFVDGTLYLNENVTRADNSMGMTVSLFSREILRKENFVHTARANLGQRGLVHKVAAVDPFRRPKDEVRIDLMGSGLSPELVLMVTAQVPEFDMGPGAPSYVSPTKIRISFNIPAKAPEGSYGIVVRGTDRKVLLQKENVFTIVPPLWVAGVEVVPAVTPGRSGALKINGRDLTQEFANGLLVQMDEPDIQISDLKLADPSTVQGTISVSSAVAPGDYWLHLFLNGKPLKPQYGSLIRVGD